MSITKVIVTALVTVGLFLVFDYQLKRMEVADAKNELGRKQIDLIVERLLAIERPHELELTYDMYKEVFRQNDVDTDGLDTIISQRLEHLYRDREAREMIQSLTRKLNATTDPVMQELLIKQIETIQHQLE